MSSKEEKKMATLELKKAELKFETFDKFEKFIELVSTKNTMSDEIKKRIQESPSVPRRKNKL